MNKRVGDNPFSWPLAIREYRKARGLSVAEFSREMGVTKQAAYFWEEGRREAPYRVTGPVAAWLLAEDARA